MEFKVRKATPEDVPAMLELVRELAIFEREPDAVTVTEEHMLEAGFGDDPVWWGWVAERSDDEDQDPDHVGSSGVENTIIGMAMCYERYSTWRGRVLYLEDIVVTDAARGKGLGQKLFKACAAYAVEKGYPHMSWQVLDWNEGAIKFYEKLGALLDGEWVNGRLNLNDMKLLVGG